MFEGEFKNNNIIRGKLFYPNGRIYEGTFCENEEEGWGRMIYECKSIYEGEWKKGMKHGKGSLQSFNLMIDGEW